jgi:predicted membrane channel-forming protein YqfA (hemolysin III family)
VGGMMTVVLLFTYAGEWIRVKVIERILGKRNKFSGSNRKFIGIWKKYGLIGVAALTPLLLTPIGGTILAVSSGSPKERIIFFMFVSAAIWSVLLSSIVYFFGNEFLPDYIK